MSSGMSSAMARNGGACGWPVTVICPSPSRRSDGFAAVSFTSTSPFSISCCTRARLTSPWVCSESCAARYWSRRWPELSGAATRTRGNSGMRKRLNVAHRRHALGCATLKPPDQPATDHQANRDQLSSGHQSTENFAASRVIGQKLNEGGFDAVQDHELGPDLPIDFLASEQPRQKQEIEEFGGGFDQLGRLNSYAQRSSTDRIRQRIMKYHSPKVISGLAEAAAGGEESEASEDVAKGESRGEPVDGSQHGHMVPPDVPDGGYDSGNQAAREYSSRLQCVDAENLAPIG